MKAEQRRYLRRSVQVEVRARHEESDIPLIFDSRNLSPGGVFLRSGLLLEAGEPLALEFTLPGMKRPIRARVHVAWVRRFAADGSEAGMGVRFLNLSPEDQRALEEFTGA